MKKMEGKKNLCLKKNLKKKIARMEDICNEND